MALPDDLIFVSVTGTITDIPINGPVSARFTSPPGVWLMGAAADKVLPPFAVDAVIGFDGSFSVQLPPTNDPAWSPVGWLYQVRIQSGSRVLNGTLAVPYNTVGAIDIADALNPEGATQAGVTYLLAGARGAAGGVAALDVDGDVTDAAGTKITGGGGGSTSWTSITGKPPTFPPTAHASSHADGGTDEVALDGSQIVSGTVPFARLPTGTGGTQVAVGNHTHAGGGGAAAPVFARGARTSGDVVSGADAGWAIQSGLTLAIPAVAGDQIELSIACLIDFLGSAADFYDLAVVVSAAVARAASTGTATPAGEGDPSLYPDTDVRFRGSSASMSFAAEAGDISGGNVTFGIIHKGSGGSAIKASAAYPFRWRAVNYGQ